MLAAMDPVLADEEPAAAPLAKPSAARARRRFVRPGMTLYEHSFSRLASGRRARTHTGDADADAIEDADHASSPGVSSLSSALDEVLNARTGPAPRSVAAPPRPAPRYEVRRDPDGTYYVADAAGRRYLADSAIGRVFLGAAPATTAAAAAADAPRFSPTGSGRRSDMDFVGSRGWQHMQAPKRQSGGSTAELMAASIVGSNAPTSPSAAEAAPSTPSATGERLSTTAKVRSFGSAVKRRVKSVKQRGSRLSRRSGVEVDVDADDDVFVDASTAVLGFQEARNRPSAVENELPMLDADAVDTRGRGDSSWEVPAVPVNNQPTTQNSAAPDQAAPAAGQVGSPSGERGRGSSDWELVPPAAEEPPKSPALAPAPPPKPLPRLQLRGDKVAAVLSSQEEDDDDEDDNELTRSFLNVSFIDTVAPRESSFEDEQAPRESSFAADASSSSNSSSSGDRNSVSANTNRSSTSSSTYAGRSSGSLDFGAGHVRVSSGGTSIADFVGGYKSQLSRRAGMGIGLGGPNADAFVNRSRSLRHGRKSPAAATPATELGRKLRDARNRIPVEFRDEITPQPVKKRRASAKSVRFNPTPQIREFEVESDEESEQVEEEHEPDEIVDAVQLVDKNEVLHAEELFFPEPELELQLLSELEAKGEVDIDALGGESDDPLAFSELRVDKPLNISDL